MQIYNTLTRKKEEFIPRDGKKVKMFVCGPTVYDYIHIGNARTFVFFDFVAKYLRFKGFNVNYIQNITDIDDKIIKKARDTGKSISEVAKFYEHAFRNNCQVLGITSVFKYIRATEHIPEIIAQIEKLIKKGFAYKIDDDGIYFDLSKFSEYGKLSGRTAQMADDAVSRVDDSDKKRNRGDFCLWKFTNPSADKGEPFWDSEFGKGRPGWHIEDTAITEKYLGSQYDIHGGGQDLIFPHHEAEIAQQVSISSIKIEDFVKFWIHTGFLVNKDQKMSKSLGNTMSINEALKKYSSEVLRFYFYSSHYRSPLDYSEELMESNSNAVKTIHEFITYKNFWQEKIKPSGTTDELDGYFEKIIGSLDDDFNIPSAIGHFFEMIIAAEPLLKKGLVSKSLENTIMLMNDVVGIIPLVPSIPEEISRLSEEREKARKSGDYKRSDKIRKEIFDLGYQVDDTEFGSLLKKI
jgi:cysteinyl-tRNA synthetase